MDFSDSIEKFSFRLKELEEAFNIKNLLSEFKNLEELEQSPTFWDNRESNVKVFKRKNILKEILTNFDDLKNKFSDLNVINEFIQDDSRFTYIDLSNSSDNTIWINNNKFNLL